MDFLSDIANSVAPYFKNIWVQIALLIIFATAHGYAGAWLAVRMLFRPRERVKLLGITIFPQGMIPRHRDRLANAIGRAVGEELMTAETISKQLTSGDFLSGKIDRVIRSFADDLLDRDLPTIVEALPAPMREGVMDAISTLERKLAERIRETLKRDESIAAITDFVTSRLDDLLGRRVSALVDDAAFEKVVGFLDARIESALDSEAFSANVRDFVSRRIDDVIKSDLPLAQMFTDDAVALLKEKAADQIEPLIHQLSELAAADKTKNQISSLIKREVHDYYEELSFFKKIFVSREALMAEVDELVNETLPQRIEETLRGAYFAEEARSFIATNIDKTLAKPLSEVIGTVAPEQLDRLKTQITTSVFSVLKSEQTREGVSRYLRSMLDKLRPHSIDAILEVVSPGSEEKLKSAVGRAVRSLVTRDETANTINSIVSAQIDRLLSRPIGRLSDYVPGSKVREFSSALSSAAVAAASEKLPEAIAEFDIQGMVRQKVSEYPPEKLEKLVLSVAGEHLRTIEIFGAVFGFAIGLVQAVQFYIYAH